MRMIDFIVGLVFGGLFLFATSISVVAYRSREYRDAILVEVCAVVFLIFSYNALRSAFS